jgi:hypothetical protein
LPQLRIEDHTRPRIGYGNTKARTEPYSDSGESVGKGEISTVVVAARACGNVKNLSLLTGYTVGGRRPAVMNIVA